MQDCFQSNFINGRKLILVTASTLTNLGIHDFDHIKVRLNRHIIIYNLGIYDFDRNKVRVNRHIKIYNLGIHDFDHSKVRLNRPIII